MNYLLLLGAGFSKNWGGWLGAEAFEYLLGCPAIRNNATLRDLLWKHQSSGGFEAALAEVQNSFRSEPTRHKAELDAFQNSVSTMFDDMNRAFLEPRFQFHFRPTNFERNIVTFLSKFDAIFTLNQDLLLERHYLTTNLAEGPAPLRHWRWHDLPGMRPHSESYGYQKWALDKWAPANAEAFTIKDGAQPLFKLHGSSNWSDARDDQLMIVGGNKPAEIQLHPILDWYSKKFDCFLRQPNTRLMIIGYGFRDEHINDAINRAVSGPHELKFFNISPEGSEQAMSLSSMRNRKQIVSDPLELMFKRGLIGASRRPLSSIFGYDIIEFEKVQRFFETEL